MGYELRSSEFLINTGLHNPTLSQPSTWEGREWGIVTVSKSHVHLHMELPTKATKNVFLQQHWPWTLWGGLLSPLSLPNETQSPLPRKRKKKKERKKKSQNQQVRVKHLWRWSAHSKGQRGSVSLVTADSDDSTHPLLQKALTYCLFINHTVGSKHGSLSYKHKRDKLRGRYSREKDKKYTLRINVCVSFFLSFLSFFFSFW